MTPTFLQRIRGVRDFRHGPRQLVIDLSREMRNQVFQVAGNLFYVWSSGASSDYIDVTFHDNHEPAFRFHAGQGMVLPFERFLVTTPAGQTGNMIILYGADAPEALYPLDARTSSMDVLTASRDVLQSIDSKLDTQVNFDLPMTSGIVWADTTPTPDAIAWSAGRVVYQGGNYDIAAGSTAQPHIYWDPADPGVFVGTGDPAQAIAGNRWVMAFNNGGAAQPAFANKLIHGGLIQAGTISAETYLQLRNTLVYQIDDSLDPTHPLEMPFYILDEMQSIRHAKLSFRPLPFRAYSVQTNVAGGGLMNTTGPANFGATTGQNSVFNTEYNNISIQSGGAHEHNLSGGTDYFPGGGTGAHSHDFAFGAKASSAGSHTHSNNDHRHSVPAHTHPLDGFTQSHVHAVDIPNHFHQFEFGIFEESTSPTIRYQVDNGGGYGDLSDALGGPQAGLDITAQLAGSGWKSLLLTATARCRIAAILELKLDIAA